MLKTTGENVLEMPYSVMLKTILENEGTNTQCFRRIYVIQFHLEGGIKC